jgi:hypothetical protein
MDNLPSPQPNDLPSDGVLWEAPRFADGIENIEVKAFDHEPHLHVFRHHSPYVDELMRRVCLSIASEFGLLARRID